MKLSNSITPAVLAAAAGLLQPYVPEITPVALVAALKQYNGTDKKEIDIPLSRKEVAQLLGVSLPTINRMLNDGILRRIKVSKRCVKIDRKSVMAILEEAVS